MTTLKNLVEAQRVEVASKLAKHDFKGTVGTYTQGLAHMQADENFMYKALSRAQGRSSKVINRLRSIKAV